MHAGAVAPGDTFRVGTQSSPDADPTQWENRYSCPITIFDSETIPRDRRPELVALDHRSSFNDSKLSRIYVTGEKAGLIDRRLRRIC